MILKITYPKVSSIGLTVFTWYVDVMFPTSERVGMSILQLWKLKLRKIIWVDQWYVHWEREELKFSYKCYNISAFIYTTLHIKYMKISYMRIYIYIYIYIHALTLTCFSCVWLDATQWKVAHQAPLSLEFLRTEYWSHDLLQGEGIKPMSPVSLTLQVDSLATELPGKPICVCVCNCI